MEITGVAHNSVHDRLEIDKYILNMTETKTIGFLIQHSIIINQATD